MDYIISEEYTLPSLGKVYDREVKPQVKLRSMTTNEEMKRLSPSDRAYKVMAEILDDCIVEDIGIPAYDLCIGDYQFLIHKLRVVTYGPEYRLECRCPYCLSTTEETINLDDIPVNTYTESIEKHLEFDLPKTKKHIKLRMQTPRIIDDVSENVKDFKKRTPSFTGDAAFLFTLKALIKEVDGQKPDPITFEPWLRSLPMADVNYLLKKAGKIVDSIGLDLDLEITCPICGLAYKSPFRATSEFYGPRIDE